MCGIAGRINSNREPIEEKTLAKMASAIRHRGPDDEGFYSKDGAGLAFRRLAIIDLSPAGHQPMSNEDGTIWIVFNGEIYNYQEHRPMLKERGHTFRSNTDTEVIVHLYEEFGTDCLQYLRGMFAFAIWDSRTRQLFLARDRLGKKPLHYFHKGSTLLFASEIKALLQDPLVPRKPNVRAIHHYLTFQYTPSPLTAFEGISKLPPAHFATFKDGRLTIQRYWKLDFSRQIQLREEEWCERIRQGLDQAVKIRLMSDVPLGAFLSGGIDSSAVVAAMAAHSPTAVKTFSIGFDESSHNELPYARLIAERFRTDHHEFTVKPNAIELLPKLVWHYGEPYADSSALPTFAVSEITRQHVTVALNGDGGDENFAGYPRYVIQRLALFYDRVPLPFKKKLLGMIAAASRPIRSTFAHRLRQAITTIGLPPDHRYLQYIGYFHSPDKRRLYTDAFTQLVADDPSENLLQRHFDEAGVRDPLDRTLYADINSYLPDDLLVKVDIASMAHSLEGRSPLLDHVFMEMTAQIPSKLKLKRFTKKYIFKKALEPILPREILYRPKMGFGVPIDSWFRGPLQSYVRDILLDPKTLQRGLFRRQGIEHYLTEHTTTRINHGYRLWALVFLELWFRTYIDPESAPLKA